MGHKTASSSVGSQRSGRSAASRGFRQGAGLWFGFFACALGTMFCVVLVVALSLVAVKAVRGSKGLPGGRTLSRVVTQVLGRGPGDAQAAVPALPQRGRDGRA